PPRGGRPPPPHGVGKEPRQSPSDKAGDEANREDAGDADDPGPARHPFPSGRSENCESAPHAHGVIILSLTDDKERNENDCHPAEREGISKLDFARTKNAPPGKEDARQNGD